MNKTESLTEYAKGMAKFREQLKQPTKDANNPFFKSKYVELEGVQKAIDDALVGTGITYQQFPEVMENGHSAISTMVIHDSGEYILFPPYSMPADKQTPQGHGSTLTYLRRYTLSAIFGVSSDKDDDGNESSGNNAKKASKSQLKQMEDLRKEYTARANLDYDAKKKLDDWVDETMANPDYLQATENAVERTIAGLKKMLDNLPTEDEKDPEVEVLDVEQVELMDRAGKPNDK